MKGTRLLIACSFVLACSITAAAQKYSGNWTGVVTVSSSDCKKVVKAQPGEYELTVLQQGDEFTIIHKMAGRPYRGSVEADNPHHVQVRGTYANSGGYITEDVSIQFADANSGTGESIWRWSDGWHQCSGRFLFTLKKKLS